MSVVWPPLAISSDPAKGRYVVATRCVAQGELMFADVSYAAFPSVRVRNYVPTLVGIGLSPTPASVAYHATQLIVRQCWDDLVRMYGVISRVPGPELDRIDALAVVTLCLLRGAAEGHEAFRSSSIESGVSEDLQVVWSSHDPRVVHPFAGPPCCFNDVAALETNLGNASCFSKKDILGFYGLFRTVSKAMEDVVHKANDSAPVLLLRMAQETFTKVLFVKMCAASQCNCFGVWSSETKLLANAIFPKSSFLNHNCMPNLARVMRSGDACDGSFVSLFFALRDIERGDEVCISYVDIRLGTGDRCNLLYQMYGFHCACHRCVVVKACSADHGLDATFAMSLPLCCECTGKGRYVVKRQFNVFTASESSLAMCEVAAARVKEEVLRVPCDRCCVCDSQQPA